MRLDKFLCGMNLGTRSQVKQLIRQKKVTVNGALASHPEQKIDEYADEIAVDNRPVVYEKYVYYMLNKPKGVVSAAKDQKEKTVLSLIDEPAGKDLFPVGRLDKDTEGLLIITNDGEMAHRMLSPKKHVDKVYHVRTLKPVDAAAKEKLENGVDIGDPQITKKAKADILSDNELLLTIHEGRYHQVKRMLAAVNNEVVGLKRIKFGALELDSALKPGESRKLTAEEVNLLHDPT